MTTQINFDTTVEVFQNESFEEIDVSVSATKHVIDDRATIVIDIKNENGDKIWFDNLSNPEQQELLDQITSKFTKKEHHAIIEGAD